MQRLTLSLSGLIATIGVVLLPLLVIPFVQVTAEDQKGILVGLVFGVALLVGAAIVFISRNALASGPSVLSVVALPLVLLASVSALLNNTPSISWLGEALEMGTVASYGLFALALALASLVPAARARFVLYVFIGSALVCGVVSAVASMFGAGSGVLSNWPTISAAVTLALVCASALADWSDEWGEREWVLALVSSVLLVCLFLFFNIVYVSIVAGAALVSVAARTVLFSIGRTIRPPTLSLLLVLSLGAAVALGVRDPMLQVPPDVRPSFEATQLVSGPSFANSLTHALIGAGPESFGQIWNKYRPQEFNQTPLWNTTFKEGNSTVATIFVELGIFGILAWLLPLIAVGVLLARAIPNVSGVSVACFFAALSYYGAAFFYTTGFVPMVLCGALLGLAAQPFCRKPEFVRVRRLPLRLIVLVLLAVPGLALIGVSSLQLISLHYRMVGIEHFEAGDYGAAHASLSKGAQYWATPRLYANDANVLLTILRDAAASSTPPREMIDQPIRAIDRAVTMDRNDLTVALTHTSIYILLVGPLRLADMQDKAVSSIGHALNLAPNRPEAPYLQAVLSVQTGRMEEARTYLAKTLSLKPDYEPALKLQKQLGEH
jgi:hypothetical protein